MKSLRSSVVPNGTSARIARCACSARGPMTAGAAVTLICMCRSTTTLSTMACRVRYLSDLEASLGERKVDLVVEGPTRKNGYIDRVARESGVLLWSSAEFAVELLHSALADAHQAAVDVATAAGVLVADYVVTPTEYAGFGTEKLFAVDALFHRYMSLVSVMQDRLFRSIAVVEQEEVDRISRPAI